MHGILYCVLADAAVRAEARERRLSALLNTIAACAPPLFADQVCVACRGGLSALQALPQWSALYAVGARACLALAHVNSANRTVALRGLWNSHQCRLGQVCFRPDSGGRQPVHVTDRVSRVLLVVLTITA